MFLHSCYLFQREAKRVYHEDTFKDVDVFPFTKFQGENKKNEKNQEAEHIVQLGCDRRNSGVDTYLTYSRTERMAGTLSLSGVLVSIFSRTGLRSYL